jgi:hypothetical protein
MAIDPIGLDDYRGLGVPLQGDATIRQQNSSNAIWTLMHASANTGRFFLGIDAAMNTSESEGGGMPDSSNLSRALCDIDADGGFRVLEGTSIKMEINSSGVYQGSTQVIELSDGLMTAPMYRETSAVSSATTAVTATSGGCGTLWLVSTNTDTVFITLPATPAVGDNYEVYSNTSAASIVNVKTAATGDNQGFFVYKSTGAFHTTASVTHGTSGMIHWRFTAISSGSDWIVASLSGCDATTTIYGLPIDGSTST